MADKQNEYAVQLKKKLDDLNYRWNIERNKLEAKAQHGSADAKKAFEEKRKEFRKMRTEMAEKIKELETARGNAWEDLKKGTEEAWGTLTKAFGDAASHFKK